jgi:YidC/Oxa1 family membrane protein insertase
MSATQTSSTDPQAAQMSQSMMITMPLMFGYLAMQMPAGLSIYFIVSNLVGMGIQWLTNRLLDDGEGAEPSTTQPASSKARSSEKSSKSRGKKRTYQKRGYKRRK